MSIKRYEVNGSSSVFENESGSLVDYQDYAALEAKCAALAAELKQSQIDAGCYKKGMEASNERLVQVAAENAGLKGCTVNHAPAVEHWNAWADAEDKIAPVPETPATDSFLAEVRAQGVEMFAEQLMSAIAVDSNGSTRARVLTRIVERVAAQLRKGAAE